MEALTVPELDEKIRAARDQLKEDPRAIEAWQILGIAHFRKGPAHYRFAVEELAKARELGSLSPTIPYYLARIYDEQNLAGPAEKNYRIVLANRPETLPARLYLARLLHRGGRSDEAVELLEEGIPLHPADPSLLVNLAAAYQAQGMETEAMDKYLAAWKISRAWPDGALAAFGDLCLKMGRPRLARAAYQAALRRNPEDPAARKGLKHLESAPVVR